MTIDALLHQVDTLASAIRNSDEAREYWQARTKMEKNVHAQELFEELKLKTNASLILKERLESSHPKVMLADMDVLGVEQAIALIPVAMQYKTAQAELNELMQTVVQVVLDTLSQEIPVELGPRQGCGQGHGGNGCDCNH